MIGHIIHVGLTVSDIDRSIEFYRDVLGLSFQGEMLMEGAETDKLFNIKDARIRVAYLNGSQEVFAPPIELLEFLSDDVESSRPDLKKISISEVCFQVDDIEKTYRDLKEKGVEFLSEPQTFDFSSQGFGKSIAVYFKDPDGIILELIEEVE